MRAISRRVLWLAAPLVVLASVLIAFCWTPGGWNGTICVSFELVRIFPSRPSYLYLHNHHP